MRTGCVREVIYEREQSMKFYTLFTRVEYRIIFCGHIFISFSQLKNALVRLT